MEAPLPKEGKFELKGWYQVPLDQWQLALGFSATYQTLSLCLPSPQLTGSFYGPPSQPQREPSGKEEGSWER